MKDNKHFVMPNRSLVHREKKRVEEEMRRIQFIGEKEKDEEGEYPLLFVACFTPTNKRDGYQIINAVDSCCPR